tara:strand:+ start:2927 stop:3076 length:150 start_codon:yes stop_codon:yes gene_type:complete
MNTSPFVFVDPSSGQILLLASSYSDHNDDYRAISLTGLGDVEYLLTEEE